MTGLQTFADDSRSDGHHAVGFHQHSHNVVHSSDLTNRYLFSELEVLETSPAGNQANTLALEYLQT